MKPTLKSLENFRIELTKVSESDGGGWFACYPELGSKLFLGWGQSEGEAIVTLRELAEDLVKDYASRKIELPEPTRDDEHSGRFLARVPKAVHARLVNEARREGVSLNTLVVSKLSDQSNSIRLHEKLDDILKEVRRPTAAIDLDQWAAFQYISRQSNPGRTVAYMVGDHGLNIRKEEDCGKTRKQGY